ncbi:MAG: DKNYY domain-containing protein [Minisyncoccota bacterium]
MNVKGWPTILTVMIAGLAVSYGILYKTAPLLLSPALPPFAPPLSDPAVFDPYGRDGVLAIDIGTLVAKRVPGGIIVRESLNVDRQGVFTAIPDASDFHRMTSSDGARTPYFRAGDVVYMFKYGDILHTSQTSLLPAPVRISGVDVVTFIPGLTPDLLLIAKDKDHTYVNGIPDPTIDAETLTAISGHPSLFEDAFHLYEFVGGSPLYTITPFDPSVTFFSSRAELDSEFGGYLKDKNGVYFQKERIVGADPETFIVFTSPELHGLKGSGPIYSYAKDKNFVYYDGVVVPHADPATFAPVDNGGVYSYYYGKDTSAVYAGTTTIPNLDPQTVRVLWYPIYEGCGLSPYVKDAAHVFFQQSVVPNADSTTFESLIDGYGRDKNGIWQGIHSRPDLPKDFQPVCNYG